MKKLYPFISVSCLLLIFALPLSAQEARKTLVKSFRIDDQRTVAFCAQGQTEVQSWSNPYVRVQIEIELESGHNAQLKSLIALGRYQLQSAQTEEALVIHAPRMQNDVKVGGQAVTEKIRYIIQMPEGVVFVKKAPEHLQTFNL